MEFERAFNPTYSNQLSFQFSKWEMEHIVKGLKKEIKLLEAKIQRVIGNPKNEGQATYLLKIDQFRNEIEGLQYIIDTMT